jgi:uncharacterized SAM-binding protein YcdF (DUF218 family)
LRRPTLAADLARLGLAAVVVSAAFASYAAVRIWQVGARDDTPAHADAIVVLGASQEHGRPLPVLRARLDHAIALYETGVARWFVVTGGTAEGDETSEAEAARAYAIANGVPADAILAETAGTNTLSSLRGVRQLFQENGLNTGIFVSDSTHLYRVLRMARDLGMEAHGSGATDSPIDRDGLSRVLSVGREVLATAEYLLFTA